MQHLNAKYPKFETLLRNQTIIPVDIRTLRIIWGVSMMGLVLISFDLMVFQDKTKVNM